MVQEKDSGIEEGCRADNPTGFGTVQERRERRSQKEGEEREM